MPDGGGLRVWVPYRPDIEPRRLWALLTDGAAAVAARRGQFVTGIRFVREGPHLVGHATTAATIESE